MRGPEEASEDQISLLRVREDGMEEGEAQSRSSGPRALRNSKMLHNDYFSMLFVSVWGWGSATPFSLFLPSRVRSETEEGEAQRRPERTRSPYYA